MIQPEPEVPYANLDFSLLSEYCFFLIMGWGYLIVMGMKAKSKVSADLKQNLLQIILVGSLTKGDLQAIYTDIRFCVADLKPGFNVVNDFSQCKVGHLSGLGTFKRIREYLVNSGVGTVIRVAEKRQLVFHQISKIVDRSSTYKIIYVATSEEAQRTLAGLAGLFMHLPIRQQFLSKIGPK